MNMGLRRCEACELPLGNYRIQQYRKDDKGSHYICLTCAILEKHGLIFILEQPDGTIKVQKT